MKNYDVYFESHVSILDIDRIIFWVGDGWKSGESCDLDSDEIILRKCQTMGFDDQLQARVWADAVNSIVGISQRVTMITDAKTGEIFYEFPL